MAKIYKNIKGNSTSDHVYTMLSKVVAKVGGRSTDINLTHVLISNTSASVTLLCDIYIRKVIGNRNQILEHKKYYLLKSVNIPVSASLLPLGDTPFTYSSEYDLVVQVNGASTMTGDIIVNYE